MLSQHREGSPADDPYPRPGREMLQSEVNGLNSLRLSMLDVTAQHRTFPKTNDWFSSSFGRDVCWEFLLKQASPGRETRLSCVSRREGPA